MRLRRAAVGAAGAIGIAGRIALRGRVTRQVRAAVAHGVRGCGTRRGARARATRLHDGQIQLEEEARPPTDPRLHLQLRLHRACKLAADREAESLFREDPAAAARYPPSLLDAPALLHS